MVRIGLVIVVTIVAAVVVGCAAGTNPLTGTSVPAGEPEDPAGFLRGLWHGFISLFAFIVSLFSDSVGIYEVHNTGAWYDFGFILGAMAFFGGGGGGASRRGCR